MYTRTGEITGINFIDSTPIQVCHCCRALSHKVFEGYVSWGKNSVGWHYGFKLHLVINDKGELLAFKLAALPMSMTDNLFFDRRTHIDRDAQPEVEIVDKREEIRLLLR